MRLLLIVGWLFVGLGGAIFHFGEPGERQRENDQLGVILADAQQSAQAKNWAEAVEQFGQAVGQIPPEKVSETRRVTLEMAKCQMMASKLPEARLTLETLLAEARQDETEDPQLVNDVQSALANSQYYITWLMRLQGFPEAEWKPEIEAARQHYSQLVLDADANGDEALKIRHAEDLESAIRLARMDLSELQGLPLPNQ